MKNETVIASKRDFNAFTLSLKGKCLAEGTAQVRLRNGDLLMVVYRPANPEAFELDPSFHTADHSMYWEPSGHSVTSANYDIVEFGPGCERPKHAPTLYEDLKFEDLPRVRGTVVRGFIMRHESRQTWPAVLVKLPPGVRPEDPDAVPHYRRGRDGLFVEHYGREASSVDAPVFVLKEDVCPSPKLDADERFKQACWLAMETAVMRYLMCNANGRWDGAEKAHRHDELCRFYVAAIRGVSLEGARREYEDDYQLVHEHTQLLTDNLDEAIGFPLESTPDYDVLGPKFFEVFHNLALEALSV